MFTVIFKFLCVTIFAKNIRSEFIVNDTYKKYVLFVFLNILLQAIQCLKAAIQYSKHDISFVMLAKCYLTEGNLEAAIDVYKKAVE